MAVKVALLMLMISFLHAAPPACSERRGFRATMTRTEKTINYTRAAQQSHERLCMLASRLTAAAGRVSTQTPLRMEVGGGAYDMEFSIGTPPLQLSALADTGSDLIWTKCGACASCTPSGSPSYYPDKSSSFSKLPCSDRLCQALGTRRTCGAGGAECDYRYSYGLVADSHHYTQGYLGNETFTIGEVAVPGVGFGCTNRSEGDFGMGSGLVGLGRGPLSLVSQLNVGAFSYCLTPDTSKASPLRFGSLANLTGAGVQSTRLLGNNTYYAVDLQSISIGEAETPGPVTDGVVFDSGTTLTFLAEPSYTLAEAAIMSQTALPLVAGRNGWEPCFQVASGNGSSDGFPTMVLHFDGGANMALPTSNYFVEVDEGVKCWVVQRSPSLSIIGNIMQMNYHIRHDVDMSVLSFQPADCSSL